ncbi:MAG: RDD family protein [Pseudomonas sp.]
MTTATTSAQAPVAGLRRRLAALVYEGVLLFGVLMIAALVYGLAMQQRHALVGLHGLQLFLFMVLGLYFTWFWTHGGQTVAMKTWHVRLLSAQGQPVGAARALLRYVLSWLWFGPALVCIDLAGLRSGGAITLVLLTGMLLYALLSRFNQRQQYLHDLLCGTELVYWPTIKRKPK